MAANEATLKPKEMDLTAYQMAHFEQLLMRRLDEIINECENLDQMVQKLEAEVEKASALGKKSI